jgi:hypothetical protein
MVTWAGLHYRETQMDNATRNEIAKCLETLAAQTIWNEAIWQRCFDLVNANANDELVSYFIDDLIHYTGRPLFRSEPRPKHIQSYSQEFRDMAQAVRAGMPLAEFKKSYGW